MTQPSRKPEYLRELAKLDPIDCGACQVCCVNDNIYITPEDAGREYLTEVRNGRTVLQRKASGACIYLGSSGCTIQETKPYLCRTYDCRAHALAVSRLSASERAKRSGNPALAVGRAKLAV